MKNGTISIVRETSGSCDTVKSFNKFTDTGNGLSF